MKKNWAKNERGLGHVIYYCIMGPPYYLRLGLSYKRQICSWIEGREY